MKPMLLPLLLLVFIDRTSANNRSFPSLTSESSQYFEYVDVTLKCQPMDSDDWTVWRYTLKDLQMSRCGDGWGSQATSACSMKTVKQMSSGVYWCQSKHGRSSYAVNITITDGPVILQSPVPPVAEGENITLHCKTRGHRNNLPATFYKDGIEILKTTVGHMTIHHFSKSDEGAYNCVISDQGESPTVWLLIKDELEPASLSVSPDSSQLFEYESRSLSCTDHSHSHRWTVKRFTTVNRKLSSCGDDWGSPTPSGCNLTTAMQKDTATYWCESSARQRSHSVNITVHDGPVILQSPVLPVAARENVTLLCRTKSPPFNLPAVFYKNGAFLRRTPTGDMTMYFVSKSDEGVYKCDIRDQGVSPPAWLFVTDDSVGVKHSLIMLVVVHVVLSLPYVVSTLLLVSVGRQRSTEMALPVSMTMPLSGNEYEGLEHGHVIAEVTTEYHF